MGMKKEETRNIETGVPLMTSEARYDTTKGYEVINGCVRKTVTLPSHDSRDAKLHGRQMRR